MPKTTRRVRATTVYDADEVSTVKYSQRMAERHLLLADKSRLLAALALKILEIGDEAGFSFRLAGGRDLTDKEISAINDHFNTHKVTGPFVFRNKHEGEFLALHPQRMYELNKPNPYGNARYVFEQTFEGRMQIRTFVGEPALSAVLVDSDLITETYLFDL